MTTVQVVTMTSTSKLLKNKCDKGSHQFLLCWHKVLCYNKLTGQNLVSLVYKTKTMLCLLITNPKTKIIIAMNPIEHKATMALNSMLWLMRKIRIWTIHHKDWFRIRAKWTLKMLLFSSYKFNLTKNNKLKATMILGWFKLHQMWQ